jgi:pimeloyl-ACP methyl ester carboxylesterase
MTFKTLALSTLIAAALLGGAAFFVAQRAAAREAAAMAAYPPTGQFVTVNGIKIHYEMAGSGPDVILIHGALGNLRDMTFDLKKKLTERYRVIAFDRPGFGYSDPLPGGEVSLDAQAQILQAAAKQIGITNPIVLGHSYGGAVAMDWALHPDILPPAAIVLVSAPTLPWPGKLDILYRVTGNPIGASLVVPLITAFVTDDYLHKSVTSIFAPSPVPAGYEKFVGSGLTLRRTSLATNGKQVNTLYDQVVAMAPLYPTLTLPVELVHGDADTSVPLTVHALPLSKILPNATLTVIPGAGHMPHHSNPDVIIAAIDRAAKRAHLP